MISKPLRNGRTLKVVVSSRPISATPTAHLHRMISSVAHEEDRLPGSGQVGRCAARPADLWLRMRPDRNVGTSVLSTPTKITWLRSLVIWRKLQDGDGYLEYLHFRDHWNLITSYYMIIMKLKRTGKTLRVAFIINYKFIAFVVIFLWDTGLFHNCHLRTYDIDFISR